jgi:putative protease|tara:strand:+ start:10525 stop:10788 length:264 start_codon:yes stop_codon:yes gene_type:complete
MEKSETVKETQVGKVSHYFDKIGVAVIEVSGQLKVGDEIHIKGHTTDFKQKITSMQIEKDKIQEAKSGQSVGMKVDQQVRANDLVLK